MTSPNIDLEGLLTLEPIRRLLLNFLHFHKFRIFPSDFDLPAATRGCFDGIDVRLAPRELCNVLENNIAMHFFGLLKDQMFLEASNHPEFVYRVLDYNRIAGGSHTLLNVVELARRGVNFRDKSQAGQKALATYVSDEHVLDKNLVMRGFRFPFAWMTDHDLMGSAASKGIDGAEHVCQLLALSYSGSSDEVSLFLLKSPVDSAVARFRRPTPFDGFGGRFFKARTLRDTDSEPCSTGFTLSLADLRTAAPPFHSNSFDGVTEVAVHDFSVQLGARCEWLGFFNPNWVEVDPNIVDQILIGEVDVSTQLREAIAVITSLLELGDKGAAA